MLIASLLLLASAPDETCDLRAIRTAKEAHEALSRRAIEIISAASKPDADVTAKLEVLVAPTAPFTLGAGDVGRPLGSGPKAAVAMAKALNADSYRFVGWDYLDGPADACAERKVTVEFSNGKFARQAAVEFLYSDGRLASAKGWEHSVEAGSMNSNGEPPTYTASQIDGAAGSADLIVVGEATSRTRSKSGEQGVVHGFTKIGVEQVVKGVHPDKEIWVQTWVNMSGFEYPCCQPGKRYIFFLKAHGGEYFPVREHGIIEI